MAGGLATSLATLKRCGVALVFVLIINSRSDNWISDRRYCVEALADIQVKLLQVDIIDVSRTCAPLINTLWIEIRDFIS